MTQTPQPPRDWQKDMEMCKAATPGVWMADEVSRTWYGDRVGYFVMGEHFTDNNDGGIYGGGTFLRFEDAKFAAKAHAALPYWLREAKELRGILDDRNMRLDALEDKLVAAEAREQRLKEAVETIKELSKWDGISQYLDRCYIEARDILATLYPDTPAPKEGDTK